MIQARIGVSALQDIFSLGDQVKLRTQLTNAEFRNVEVEPVSKRASFPNPEQFLAGEIDVDTAAIPSMQGLDEGARQAIVAAIAEDMRTPLLEVTQEDHVVIKFHAFVVRAER